MSLENIINEINYYDVVDNYDYIDELDPNIERNGKSRVPQSSSTTSRIQPRFRYRKAVPLKIQPQNRLTNQRNFSNLQALPAAVQPSVINAVPLPTIIKNPMRPITDPLAFSYQLGPARIQPTGNNEEVLEKDEAQKDPLTEDTKDNINLLKQFINDPNNPFEMTAELFKNKFRFNPESVLHITSLIRSDLEKHDKRGRPTSPEVCVLLTLRFYATSSTKLVCGDFTHISQPTISNIVTKVSMLLAQLKDQYIKFPEGSEATVNRELFKDLGHDGNWPGLPDIDGAIDCTHVKIVSTPGYRHLPEYRYGKSEFSINVQAVAGPRTEILDIDAKWPGSTEASRIFGTSSVYQKYMQGELTGRLVGDNVYPTLSFVLTPITPPPEDAPSIRYNTALIRTRMVVQETFRKMKQRFPCLTKGLGNKLSTVLNVIEACAVLHNLGLFLNDEIPMSEQEDIREHQKEHEIDTMLSPRENGFLIRHSIIENNYQ